MKGKSRAAGRRRLEPREPLEHARSDETHFPIGVLD
jgi:hypothetical protein